MAYTSQWNAVTCWANIAAPRRTIGRPVDQQLEKQASSPIRSRRRRDGTTYALKRRRAFRLRGPRGPTVTPNAKTTELLLLKRLTHSMLHRRRFHLYITQEDVNVNFVVVFAPLRVIESQQNIHLHLEPWLVWRNPEWTSLRSPFYHDASERTLVCLYQMSSPSSIVDPFDYYIRCIVLTITYCSIRSLPILWCKNNNWLSACMCMFWHETAGQWHVTLIRTNDIDEGTLGSVINFMT
jgi:hypothetical protein